MTFIPIRGHTKNPVRHEIITIIKKPLTIKEVAQRTNHREAYVRRLLGIMEKEQVVRVNLTNGKKRYEVAKWEK